MKMDLAMNTIKNKTQKAARHLALAETATKNRLLAALVLAVFLLFLPAAAEARDMGRYSVEPPPGWKVDQGDLLDLFTSPDESFVIYLVRDKHEGDFSELIEMWTDDERAARSLIEPGRSFIYEKRGLKPERGWVGLAALPLVIEWLNYTTPSLFNMAPLE